MVKKVEEATAFVIEPPNYKVLEFEITGDAPYVQLRFSQKQRNKLHEKHAADEKDAVTKKKYREPKDYDALFEESMYKTPSGRRGINAMSFKRAMVAACRLTSLPMKTAKLCMFVVPDGFDEFEEGIPMVYFTTPEDSDIGPHLCEHVCRNANGMPDLRIRAMWDAGWTAKLRVRYDADMLAAASIANLLVRAGSQVGIGEGRPDTNKSDGSGMGWGTFKVTGMTEEAQ
jgi:hypothetical protein